MDLQSIGASLEFDSYGFRAELGLDSPACRINLVTCSRAKEAGEG